MPPPPLTTVHRPAVCPRCGGLMRVRLPAAFVRCANGSCDLQLALLDDDPAGAERATRFLAALTGQAPEDDPNAYLRAEYGDQCLRQMAAAPVVQIVQRVQ